MAALALNNAIVGYRLFDISFDRIIQLLLFVLLLPGLWRDIESYGRYRDIFLLFVAMFFCLLAYSLITLVQSGHDWNEIDILRDIVRSFYFIIILALVNYSIIRNRNSIYIYLAIMFIFVLFGIGHYLWDYFVKKNKNISLKFFDVLIGIKNFAYFLFMANVFILVPIFVFFLIAGVLSNGGEETCNLLVCY